MLRWRRYFADDVDADVGVQKEYLSSHVVYAADANDEIGVDVTDGRADFGAGGGAEDPALFHYHTSYLPMTG